MNRVLAWAAVTVRSLRGVLARRLLVWALACLVGVLVSFVQVATYEPSRPLWGWPQDLRVRAMRSVFEADRFSDIGDMKPAIEAARALSSDGHAPIYASNSTEGAAFIYPPIAAAMYAPIANGDEDQAKTGLIVANRVLLLGIFIALIAFIRPRERGTPWWEVAGVTVALGIYYPLLRALALNQAAVVVTFFLALTFALLSRGRERGAGVAFAAAIAIKPHLALALPLVAFASRRFVAATLVCGACLLALSVAYAGVANHIAYVSEVLPSLSRGYAFFPNHSWNGFFNRLVLPYDLEHFAIAPRLLTVTVLSNVAAAACYIAGIYVARRFRDAPLVWIFAWAWLLTALVSPVSWEHHYAPAIFVFALIYVTYRDADIARAPKLPAWPLAPLAIAFTLIAGYFEVRDLEGVVPVLLVSYLFYGAVLLAICCCVLLRSMSGAATEQIKAG